MPDRPPSDVSHSGGSTVIEEPDPCYYDPAAVSQKPRRPHPKPPRGRRIPGAGVLIFGVILPAVTLVFELITRVCASAWFDPLPTIWHVLAVALVPVANLLVFLTRYSSAIRFRSRLAHLNAAALGVSVFYGLAFLPYAPFSMLGLLAYFLGIIPLTPIFAFFATLSARRCIPDWDRLPGETPSSIPSAKPWASLAFAALALPVIQTVITDHGVDLASRPDPIEQQRGLSLLRTFGSERAMIDRCYGSLRFSPLEILGPYDKPDRSESVAAARLVFYRVTGEPFTNRQAPGHFGARGFLGLRGEGFDRGLGGTSVAGKVSGLTLETSRLEGKVDAAALTSYTEWTMVFKNVTVDQAEARAQIELPPGGVVSRLTLWIDGEPREAAFGGRSQVRAAYQEVAVVQRRDPVLVTTAGPDRVLMQCFPVPANGGEMKVRLGITAPLLPIDRKSASHSWPRMLETNFENARGLEHRAEIGGDVPLADGRKNWRGKLDGRELAAIAPVRIPLPNGIATAVGDDPTDANFVIRQTIESAPLARPERLVFVIDGSRSVKRAGTQIRNAFRRMPNVPAEIFFAGDAIEKWSGSGDPGEWIGHREFRGGRDNLPALEAAWHAAAQAPGAALIWIAGPQPVLLSELDSLRQRIEQSPVKPALHLASAGIGPNRVLEGLDGLVSWERLAGGATLEENLNGWFQMLREGRRLQIRRERIARSDAGAAPMADGHLARLWGREEIERLRVEPARLDSAMKLAIQLQLVTPVSGAVVLERQEQYERHGLKPADAGTVPVIPEPAAFALLAAGAAWLGLRRKRFPASHV